MQYLSSRRVWIAAGVLSLLSTTLLAQEADDRGPWRIALGGGVGVRPDFPGSDSVEVRPVPAFDVAYGPRWFFSNEGLGVRLVRDDRWLLSTSVTLDLSHRDADDSDHLRGTEDIDRTAVAVVKTGYRFGALTATVAVARDIADEGHGTVVDLSLQAHAQPTSRLALDYGISGRWAGGEYMETFFGVTSEQSARSALASYSAGSGFDEARAFVYATYVLNPNWVIGMSGSVGRLLGDAADSPITEEEGFFTADTVLIYRF